MNLPVGIRSITVKFPRIVRTNDYWREKFPELVDRASPKRVRLERPAAFSTDASGIEIWSQEVKPYLADPFRGNVERRVLDLDESSLTLECDAAREAIAAANLATEEVDLAIACSLCSDRIAPGSAADLVRELELSCPAWNLESTCSSALVALQNAWALVQTGLYRHVLVVISYIGSHSVDEEDTLSWSVGDGAGAFIVSALKPNQGILGTKIVPTAATCGAYLHEIATDTQGRPWVRTKTGKDASLLAETAVDFVRTCCHGAAAAAGVTLEQIDFFAFNTPTAWYANVCTRALGIDPERTINLYPRYANIGAVLPVANLYYAALEGKIGENDLVLVYTNGAGATAAAIVMRWGDVALGVAPIPPTPLEKGGNETFQGKGGSQIPPTPLGKGGNETLQGKGGSQIPPTPLGKGGEREKIFAAAPQARQQMIESYLIEWLAGALQIPQTQLNSQQSLAFLLDSLMAFELRRRIEVDLQVQVPIERFFGDSNIAQIAEFLRDRLVLAHLVLAHLTASSVFAIDRDTAEREKLSF